MVAYVLKCVSFEKSPKKLNFLVFFSGGKFKLQKNERTYKIFDDFSNKMHFRTIGVMRSKPFYTRNQNEIKVVLAKLIMGHWDSD